MIRWALYGISFVVNQAMQLSGVPQVEGYKVMVASLPGYEVIRILFEVVKKAASSNFITS